MVIKRRGKPSGEHLYDYVPPPALPERIRLEENNAYGTHNSTSSSMKFNVSHGDPNMEDNCAYGTQPELTSTSPSPQSNICYGISFENDASETQSQLTSTFPSIQYNVSYGLSVETCTV